jgi:hypothetical protein
MIFIPVSFSKLYIMEIVGSFIAAQNRCDCRATEHSHAITFQLNINSPETNEQVPGSIYILLIY